MAVQKKEKEEKCVNNIYSLKRIKLFQTGSYQMVSN